MGLYKFTRSCNFNCNFYFEYLKSSKNYILGEGRFKDMLRTSFAKCKQTKFLIATGFVTYKICFNFNIFKE